MQNLNSNAAGTNVNECGRKTLVFPVSWKPWIDSPLPGGTGGWSSFLWPWKQAKGK